jgi:non-canonical poly(A) RNA polymerase PAPD5/7
VAKIVNEREDLFSNINLVTNAKVPLIKFEEKETTFNYDISINKTDGIKQLD